MKISDWLPHRVKIGLDLDAERPPEKRGVLAWLNRKLHPRKTIPNRRASIFLNRYCNLDCYSCAALGMHPEPAETSIEDIEDFLWNTRNYRPGGTVMLTGGEPTLVDREKLRRVVKMIRNVGRKVGMLTNGARLLPVEWFDYVVLDNHGVNAGDLVKWREALEAKDRWHGETVKHHHQDIRHALEGNITKGARCANWLSPIVMWNGSVYPCCNMMCAEWWQQDAGWFFEEFPLTIADALYMAGWSARNPDLADTIKNWRTTLPPEAYRICMIGCWKHHTTGTKWRTIT